MSSHVTYLPELHQTRIGRLLCWLGLHYWSFKHMSHSLNPRTHRYDIFAGGYKRCGRCGLEKEMKKP
jgi:hypothetical protein